MRRKIMIFLACLPMILLAACQKSSEASLKPGIYTLQDAERDVPGDFTISIYEDGTFQCYETPISSYLGVGHYSIEDDVVILKEDEAGCTGDINYYKISDDGLHFIWDGSANYHFVPLEDGAWFRMDENSTEKM